MSEILESETPPTSEDKIAGGTDIDEVLKRAQDEKRTYDWYGMKPGEIASNDQIHAMEDNQSIADEHGNRAAERKAAEDRGEEYFIERESTPDAVQEKQAEQSEDLGYLISLFRERSDKEHQGAAWQLFDEFIDSHGMSKPQERVLRNYLIDVSREAPGPSETPPTKPQSAKEETEAPTPIESSAPAPDVEVVSNSGQPSPSGGSTEGEASPEPEVPPSFEADVKPVESAAASRDPNAPDWTSPTIGETYDPDWTSPTIGRPKESETEPPKSEEALKNEPATGIEFGEPHPVAPVYGETTKPDSESPERKVFDYELDGVGPFVKNKPVSAESAEPETEEESRSRLWQQVVEQSKAEPIPASTESAEPDVDEEEERKSTWRRIKEAPTIVYFKVDQYFNGGEPEQNRKRKVVAAAIGVGVVGVCVAVGVVQAHNAHDAVNTAQNEHIKSVLSVVTPDMGSTTGATELANGGGSGVAEAIRSTGGVIHEHLGGSGDTIWSHAKDILQQWGVKPSNHNILRLTSSILGDNGISWSDARHLSNGYDFVVNKPIWVQ